MPLLATQDFYGADNRITSVVLDVEDKHKAELAVSNLNNTLSTENYEIKDWKAMMPEIISMKEMKESSNKIVMFILYFIVAFGIFGTILMMTKERQYEFGVLISIGMKRKILAFTIWLETMFLGVLGALFGIGISYAIMYYLCLNPIEVTGDMAAMYTKFGIEPLLPASVDIDIFVTQAFIVFLLTSFLALYPCLSIMRMKPVEAMRA